MTKRKWGNPSCLAVVVPHSNCGHDEYEGSPLAHASIERRVVDRSIPLTEIGVRSFSPEEAAFMKTSPDVAVVWGYQLARGDAVIPWERLSEHLYGNATA